MQFKIIVERAGKIYVLYIDDSIGIMMLQNNALIW